MSGVHDPTFLDRVEGRAELLVTCVKAFEAELGSQRAHSIARDALRRLR